MDVINRFRTLACFNMIVSHPKYGGDWCGFYPLYVGICPTLPPHCPAEIPRLCKACPGYQRPVDSRSRGAEALPYLGVARQPHTDMGRASRPRQRAIWGESELWTTAPVVHKGSQYLCPGGSAPCGNLVGNPWGLRGARPPHMPDGGLGGQPAAGSLARLLTSPQALLLRLPYIIRRLLGIILSWGCAAPGHPAG